MSDRTSALPRAQAHRCVSRRVLIGGTAGLMAAGYLASGVGASPAGAEAASFDLLSRLTRAHFTALVGHTFQIQASDGRVVEAVLRRVRVPRPTARARRVETFTLIFSSHQQSLPQDT